MLNNKTQEVTPKEGKKFSLTTQETANLRNRMAIKQEYDYMSALVNKDMTNYVDMAIKPRLAIKREAEPIVNIEEGTIFVPETAEVKADVKPETVQPKV